MQIARNLEKFIAIEDKLRTEYRAELETKTAELERCQQELATLRQQLQATIDRQLETIAELSGRDTANQHAQQLNRDVSSRTEGADEGECGALLAVGDEDDPWLQRGRPLRSRVRFSTRRQTCSCRV